MVLRILLTLLLVALLSACGVNRYLVPPYEEINLLALKDINPDYSGRPSPVSVRVFELSRRTTFDNLDFDAAFSNAETLLGDELLSTSEVMIQPGESVLHRVELNGNAKFIAIVAAFRDIDHARWRLVYQISGNWYSSHAVQLTDRTIAMGDNEYTDK